MITRLHYSPESPNSSFNLAPLDILHHLRENKLLTLPYYLHLNHDTAEIGWQAKTQVAFLNGEESNDWRSALKALGDKAATLNNKAFGYLGFDVCDHSQGIAPDHSATFPLIQFFIPQHRIIIKDNLVEYHGTDAQILPLILQSPPFPHTGKLRPSFPDTQFSEQAFMQAVATATNSLSDEDINKVVLSRYLGFDNDADLLELFAEYCLKQKYTDAILLDFGTVGATIASPELLIHIDAGKIIANPLAGTRPIVENVQENCRLAKAMLNNRKELAEHTLALLQMVTELKPYCEPDTLVINKLLEVIKQNHLMHLSSELRAQLGADQHCVDAVLSLFPSAMVSGVPKKEAIQLLRQLEPFPRGLFAGTVGWISGRSCRLALTIRGIYKYGKRLFVQAGAGVMEESKPIEENAEVNLKMSAMLATLSGTYS